MSVKDVLAGIPIVGGLFDDSRDQALEQLKHNQELYGNLDTPTFDKYKPDQYKLAGQYDPEKYSAQTVSEDPGIRSAQMGVLSRLAGLSQSGLSDVDQAGYQNARNIGSQISHSGTDAALQNALARGQAGSGLEFGMREQAGQDAAQQAQQAGLQQAADSARQRALYTQAYGGQLGSQRAQDFGANQANTDIMNRLNTMNTQGANQAQQYNLQNQQGIMNANTGQNNQAQQYNNDLTQRSYQDKLQKLAGQSGANTSMAGGYAAENAANNSTRNANTSLAFQAITGAPMPNDNNKKLQEA